MEFKTFAESVQEAVKSGLPEEYKDATIRLAENYKLNEHYTGLSVQRPDQIVSPTINLNAFHEQYENGRDFDEIVDQIMDTITAQPQLDVSLDNLLTYDKSKLFIRVSNLENNQEALENAPFTKVENLAITYHLVAAQGEEGIASTMVTYPLLETLGVTKEQLHQDAMENSPKLFPAKIASMEEVMKEMMSKDMLASGLNQEEVDVMLEEMIPMGQNPMTVISNDQSINGAAVMFYPNVFEQLGERLEGNFFILPSSVHECLAIPDNGEMSYQELKAMVVEINATQVAPADRLADEVYHYDTQDHVFERADRFEARMQEKEAAKEKAAKMDRSDVGEKKSVLGRLSQKKEQVAAQPKNPAKEAAKQHKNDISI